VTPVEAFLAKFVEGYLFKDLQSMRDAQPIPPSHDGAAGYPLLVTTMAGIELLGALLSPKNFDKLAGRPYFIDYWERFLYPQAPERNVADAIYRLVRNGIAHAFVVKGDIHVYKNEPGKHLKNDNGVISIDAVALSQRFEASYHSSFRSLVSQLPTIGTRFSEIEQAYRTQATEASVVAALKALPPSNTTPISQPSGGTLMTSSFQVVGSFK
jgi:hypothetical protein